MAEQLNEDGRTLVLSAQDVCTGQAVREINDQQFATFSGENWPCSYLTVVVVNMAEQLNEDGRTLVLSAQDVCTGQAVREINDQQFATFSGENWPCSYLTVVVVNMAEQLNEDGRTLVLSTQDVCTGQAVREINDQQFATFSGENWPCSYLTVVVVNMAEQLNEDGRTLVLSAQDVCTGQAVREINDQQFATFSGENWPCSYLTVVVVNMAEQLNEDGRTLVLSAQDVCTGQAVREINDQQFATFSGENWPCSYLTVVVVNMAEQLNEDGRTLVLSAQDVCTGQAVCEINDQQFATFSGEKLALFLPYCGCS